MPFNSIDAQKSCAAFEKFTAPVIRHALNAKFIQSTERRENNLAKILDFAGVDGIIVGDDDFINFYASRIQFGVNYSAFSIRRTRPSGEPTEFAKLCKAWRLQKPMPRYHVHTYINKDEQSAIVACAETVEILKYIDKHRDQWRTAPTGETFYFIYFADVDCKIFSVDATGNVKKISRS